MTLNTLRELQEEIELYCDPNERVTNMIERFIDIEAQFESMRQSEGVV